MKREPRKEDASGDVGAPAPSASPPGAPRPSKKAQILALFEAGINTVEDLALLTQSRPAYVASVLQQSRKLTAYFDLYTSSRRPMNVYSKYFAGQLGFKDLATAHASLEHIDHFYRQFDLAGDRAGQHHALLMALTLFDRARWTGKAAEARVFGQWLIDRITEGEGLAMTPPRVEGPVALASSTPLPPAARTKRPAGLPAEGGESHETVQTK